MMKDKKKNMPSIQSQISAIQLQIDLLQNQLNLLTLEVGKVNEKGEKAHLCCKR